MRIKKFYPIILSAIAVFCIRLLLSFLPSFGFDMGSWLGWADRLTKVGFPHFYSDQSWTQYTPGYMYFLWLIGKLNIIGPLAVKIPTTLADIAVGFLIWFLVRKRNSKLALVSFFLYTLNPVTVFDGPIWGQIDGILTLFLFLSAVFLIERKSFVLSALFWSIAFLIKPQSVAVAPIFLIALAKKYVKVKDFFVGGVVSVASIIAFSWPFFVSDPILGLPRQILKMGNYYSYTSVFAFNIWSWVGFWKPDTMNFLGLSLSVWGILLLSVSIIFSLIIFRNKLGEKNNFYLLFAILSLCFFLFPTKVHERYLFPFFAFLLTSAGISGSFNLFAIYVVSSLATFLNLFYPYSYYYPDQLKSVFLHDLGNALAKFIGAFFVVVYFVLNFWERIPKIKFSKFTFKSIKKTVFPPIKLKSSSRKLLLIGILIFAFATRVYNLGSPKQEYFDEVYHAFTAKVILHGDPKAWEWWNTPPAGFAYEWTHPPLAKLGMVVGMKIFGENPFGYRIPGAILGVGVIFLTYLLAKEIFKDEIVGLVSASVLSLDGLTLVMSRIGMNDIYLLFFALLSIYFFVKKKDFYSAISFGLALSSKWSAIWVVPILTVLWLRRKQKFPPSILWFFVLPFGVYLASYAVMFLTGHSLNIWWEMQKQMWWYHTGLRASHPYSSLWWSWPFMIRPIYLYTSSEIGGMVSRIYAMGNPVIFWFGLASVLISFAYSYVEKNKNLGIIIFAYLIFFVPWAASPRIMFLYHYLPSVPFLAIATGYVLRRGPKLILPFIFVSLVFFAYFYPHFVGLNIPLWLDKSYYWTSSWR